MSKSAVINVRFTPEEADHIRAIVKVNSGSISEFIRLCVNRALAEEGDPEAVKMLGAMMEKGILQLVERRVKAAIREERKKSR